MRFESVKQRFISQCSGKQVPDAQGNKSEGTVSKGTEISAQSFCYTTEVESKQDDKKLTKGEDSPQNGCWQGTAILNYDHVLNASPVT